PRRDRALCWRARDGTDPAGTTARRTLGPPGGRGVGAYARGGRGGGRPGGGRAAGHTGRPRHVGRRGHSAAVARGAGAAQRHTFAVSRHWAGLDRELDAWAEAGRTATFWWRDDDAAERTRALDRLLDLAERTGTPIGIAVIPAAATSALVSHLDVHPRTTILQHGWAHVNHALAGAKRAELGGDRPIEAVRNDIARGRSRLRELLGRPAPPSLVPPWNRIAPEVASGLPSLGLRGLSTYAPRSAGRKCGLARVNCHIDPIDWRGTRRYVGEERAVQ